MSVSTTSPITSTLLPEILSFAPQLLLDDIINTANNAIYHCVDALEPFLYRWAEQRTLNLSSTSVDWSGEREIEQGLVSFQTLLEQHVDIAFDFLEVWSLRNIFAFPADLPIVVPHQRNLDLNSPPGREDELFLQVEELRRKIENQRRLRSLFVRAIARAEARAKHSKTRLETMSFLDPLLANPITSVPIDLEALFKSMGSLPPEDLTTIAQLHAPPDPTRRPWETSQRGYLHWAVGKLVERARNEHKSMGAGQSAVGLAADMAQSVGRVADLRRVLSTMEDEEDDMSQITS